MKHRWLRTLPLDIQPQERMRTEEWQYWQDQDLMARTQVAAYKGKPLNLKALKGTDLQEWEDYARHLEVIAGELYLSGQLYQLETCPCCTAPQSTAQVELQLWGADYTRCQACQHVFINPQPMKAALNALFSESESHAEIYTDPEKAEIRLQEIVTPKLNWVQEQYQRVFQAKPLSVLDVGAGGGHFVAACLRAGLQAKGIEISHPSVAFAQAAFQIELENRDFLTDPPEEKVDIITFWGLLEYTPEPLRFLKQARQCLQPQGLLIAEVPRFDCLSTAAQQAPGARVARHLDPTSHVNCFSDHSLLTALWQAGFQPVASWHFGMDIFEILVQSGLRQQQAEIADSLWEMVPKLQQYLDSASLSDDLIIAAIPRIN